MKVSIITVSYNSAATIGQAMASVLGQTYRDIDYWVIDGGSTDGTVEIIKEYEAKAVGRLHWISEQDHGLYDAMNKGISRCTGDIIGILNSDDFFTSDTVVETIASSFTDDIDAIYGDVHFVRPADLTRCIRYYSGRIFRPSMVKFGFIPPHPSFYIRRSIFEQYGSYDPTYRISADFELIARLCYKYRIRTRYLHLDVVTMRTGGASTRDFQARWVGTMEDIRACKALGLRTNQMMIFCKYIIKIASAIFIRS